MPDNPAEDMATRVTQLEAENKRLRSPLDRADAKRAASYLRHLSGKHDASYRRVAAFLDRLADV